MAPAEAYASRQTLLPVRAGDAVKRGKHRPCPPASAPIQEVLGLLALLGWKATGTEERYGT